MANNWEYRNMFKRFYKGDDPGFQVLPENQYPRSYSPDMQRRMSHMTNNTGDVNQAEFELLNRSQDPPDTLQEPVPVQKRKYGNKLFDGGAK